MTKMIEIKDCDHCPFLHHANLIAIDHCTHNQGQPNAELDRYDFPTWCPLPDKEEK